MECPRWFKEEEFKNGESWKAEYVLMYELYIS
jgi:hypothetical protein